MLKSVFAGELSEQSQDDVAAVKYLHFERSGFNQSNFVFYNMPAVVRGT